MSRVFISHASADSAIAAALVSGLEASEIPCWISGRDVAPGSNYQEAIVAAIRTGRALVLLLTEAANTSDEVKKEIALASAAGIPVFPVRFGAVTPNPALSYELATRQWIDVADAPSAIPALRAALSGTTRPAPLTLPDKPSVVVLPFANLSGDPEQEYFADGMTEEVTTALSRIRSFFVIARNSAFTYKGRAVDTRQVGRDLGVRYVIEGSVRKAAGRVRISAQLADAATGTQLWADRFDGALDDIFDLQDRITVSLIGAIEPRIRATEIERALRKPPESLVAYDLVLQALPHVGSTDPLSREKADRLLRQAIALAPTYTLALAQLSRHVWSTLAAISPADKAPARTEVLTLCRKVVIHGGGDPEALAEAGVRIALLADCAEGLGLVEQSLALNPNGMDAIMCAGFLHAYCGRRAEALEYVARAERLNPFEGAELRNLVATLAHFVAGDYSAALPFAEAAIRSLQTFNTLAALRYRTAALGLLGRIDEARQSAADALKVMPDLTVARAREHLEVDMAGVTMMVPGVIDAVCEGLRRAGVPE